MKLMETERPKVEHQAYCGDELKEQEGLLAELAPPDKMVHSLESQIIGKMGQSTEEDMRLLLTGGAL
jgi:hypothetical protein